MYENRSNNIRATVEHVQIAKTITIPFDFAVVGQNCRINDHFVFTLKVHFISCFS